MEATERLLIPEGIGADEPDTRAEAETAAAREDAVREEVASGGPDDGFAHAGSMLRAARESMGLNIRAVSDRINVKAERLEAIEALDVAALPAPTFTLGFVRSYARTLNLPEDALVERFRRDAGFPAPRQTPVLETNPAKDLGATPRVNLLTVLGMLAAVLWLTWQLLQSSAPDTVEASTDLTAGIPLVERARTATGVTYEVETSLADEKSLNSNLSLPKPDKEATTSPVAELTAPGDGVIVPVSADDLARALAAGEEEARTASLENIRQAESASAVDAPAGETAETVEMAALDAEAAAGEGEAALAEETDMTATETEADEAAETVTETVVETRSADELNAEALNELALRAVTEADARAAAATEGTSVPVDVTDDGIAIVEGNAADIEAAVPVVAEAARTPAAIRTVIEPVYPSRCESEAAETETVTVRYNVSRYGKVVSPEAVGSSNPCFNRAAVAAVARWDFFPAEEGGAAVTDSGRTSRVVFQRP